MTDHANLSARLYDSLIRYTMHVEHSESEVLEQDENGELVRWRDVITAVRECCDEETRDDIVGNFAERFGMPELLELDG